MTTVRDTIISELCDSVCTVTFIKVNGERRVILGTLRNEVLGDNEYTGTSSDDVIPMFDLDDDHWKSARVDSLIKVETNSKVYTWVGEEYNYEEVFAERNEDAASTYPGKVAVLLIRD